MRVVGTVKEIWRYPVKGMAGEQVESSSLTEKGLTGDRTWALRDTARKEIQSCKFRPELLLCSAKLRRGNGQVDIAFPDGSVTGSDDPGIHAKLSTLVHYPSTLEALRPDTELDFYRRHKLDDHTWLDELKATFIREPGEPLPDFSQIPPPLIDFVSIPGTFFLVTPLHLVSTATLRHLKSKNAAADWNVRRFRPNFVVEPTGGEEGFVEQGWVGKRLSIGGAAFDCAGATPRCGAITRAQPGVVGDKSVLRTVVKEADQNVGVYGLVTATGEVKVGDPVYAD
ncbi:MAG TPA: MOSC N-terminal beta barrel domain-containing protein [Burkholderiales bacterium]|nr:MOSC N-terminal beta barrel domain-containing protein [Burkholderiales bacterium]